LPLTTKERKFFVEISKFKLVKREYRRTFEKSGFLIISSMHLTGILLTDFSAFWLLSMIQYHGSRLQADIENQGKC
jgi:hypothetical protein